MPIEIIHGKQDYTKLSIKLLSENGMIGWFQTYQEILSNYFISVAKE